MNDDGQLGRPRHFHLPDENLLLHRTRRVIVKIIQADLAPGDYSGIFRQLLQLGKIVFVGQLGLMWMNANRRPDPVVLLGNLDGAIQRPRTGAATDGKNHPHACGARALQRRLTVSVKLRHLQMGVGIDQHWIIANCVIG